MSESLPRFSMDLVALIFEYRWEPYRYPRFRIAVDAADLVAMQEHLSFGANIDEETGGQSGLHAAFQLPLRKQKRIVRFLIENKANVNFQSSRERMYCMPLQLAIIDNRASICKMLIDAKASTEFVQQGPKISAFDFALSKGHEPLANLLRAAPPTWPVRLPYLSAMSSIVCSPHCTKQSTKLTFQESSFVWTAALTSMKRRVARRR